VSTSALERAFVLFALVGLAFVALVVVGRLLEAAGLGRVGSRLADALDGLETAFAWVVALTATSGSLYFSEVADFIPCELCWFQRIAMFPLPVLLLVALIRNERLVAPYVLVVALLGSAVSVYHYQLEWFPQQASICSTTTSVPCTVVWFRVWHVGTMPMLAGTAFLVIATLMAIAWRNERRSAAADDEGPSAAAEAPAGEAARHGCLGLLLLALVLALALVAAAVVGAVLLTRGGGDPVETSSPATIAGNPAAGRAVYARAGCGACHALAAAGSTGAVGPALDATTLDEGAIQQVVASGRGAMTGFGDRLSRQEIADVAAFVHGG